MHRMGLVNSPQCRNCGEDEETPVHLFTDCSAAVEGRRRHCGVEQLDEPELSKLTLEQLLLCSNAVRSGKLNISHGAQ